MGDNKNYTHNFYGGADYGLDSGVYDKEWKVGKSNYQTPAGTLSLALDGRSANQLKEVANKLNTGAKNIEVQGVFPDIAESIPKQHFKEMARLKKLVGADLTFHGPVVEPTGISRDGGWEESKREQAETQMWNSLEVSNDLNTDGNLTVVFHSSNGLPEPVTRVKRDGKEIVTDIAVINEETGQFGKLPRQGTDYLSQGGEAMHDPYKELESYNEENWSSALSNINISSERVREILSKTRIRQDRIDEEGGVKFDFEKLYDEANNANGRNFMEDLEPAERNLAKDIIGDINYANVQAADSYRMFKDAVNRAWGAAKQSGDSATIDKLKKIREKVIPVFNEYNSKDSGTSSFKKINLLNEVVIDGLKDLKNLDKVPQTFKPIEDFAYDKASETFSNLALRSYDKFKEKAPIIAIENPPAGDGLTRGHELKELVEQSRKKFANKLIETKGLSKGEAKKLAEKHIGITWDVGHINMIRKYGYSGKDTVKEAKTVAPYVKHVHLSDNFGLQHTELPMGMGNVETEEILKLSKNFQNAKKVIETANWYQHFQKSPFGESLRAFGSPIYSMQMSPSWQGATHYSQGYFSGYGKVLPDQHFNTYGAGFSNLPPELGGQMEGGSRFAGTPNQ